MSDDCSVSLSVYKVNELKDEEKDVKKINICNR